ncbi:MAG: tyrosine-type recombinase/integrase [Planctomycetota bacterium]
MPRKKGLPSLRYHISGQSVVTFCGKNFYLGPHGSPEAQARYLALCGEYVSNGMTEPPGQPERQAETVITVAQVCAEYREHVKARYSGNRQETNRANGLCTLLELEHGDVPANEFGPRRLEEVRNTFVANGNSRSYANRLTGCVVKIFRYGVSRELVDVNVIVRLQTLEALRYGQTSAPETKKVEPVELEIVEATAKHLSPIIKAMVRVQVQTGMRPGEVCKIRPCDIRTEGDVWLYTPSSHKTSHRGKTKTVPIVGDARDALAPFLVDRASDAYCFSPREAMAIRHAEAAKKRKTPKSCGNRPGTNRKANPKRVPGERYTTNGYHQAIKRAAKKAKVAHWHPYRIRHLTGTLVRQALGVEAAQALLGHSRVDTTEIYAQVSKEKAVQAAKSAPSLG